MLVLHLVAAGPHCRAHATAVSNGAEQEATDTAAAGAAAPLRDTHHTGHTAYGSNQPATVA